MLTLVYQFLVKVVKENPIFQFWIYVVNLLMSHIHVFLGIVREVIRIIQLLNTQILKILNLNHALCNSHIIINSVPITIIIKIEKDKAGFTLVICVNMLKKIFNLVQAGNSAKKVITELSSYIGQISTKLNSVHSIPTICLIVNMGNTVRLLILRLI